MASLDIRRLGLGAMALFGASLVFKGVKGKEISKKEEDNLALEIGIDSVMGAEMYGEKTQKNYQEETKRFKKIARKYGFKAHNAISTNQVVLEAKNTDGEWQTWFTINLDTGKLSLRGNTDHSNLWFHQTRRDMTPRKLVRFVKEINAFITSVNPHILVRHLIDPEDYQQIANINDAYDDERYFMGAETFEAEA
tara:strand:- start:697 stop:1278 length:582 start_codon:yes stop_codon:yes gene_type:complete